MDFLLHNWIVDMPDSLFILLSLIYCGLISLCCKMLLLAKEPALPFIGRELDPYEAAYLRGKEQDVAITGVFYLTQKGYLKADKTRVELSSQLPDENTLQPIEKELYNKLASMSDTELQNVFVFLGKYKRFTKPINSCITPYCNQYETNIEKKLSGVPLGDSEGEAWQIVMTGLILMESVFIYKLIISSITEHHRVMYLIIVLILPFIHILFNNPKNFTAHHIRKRYLEDLQATFTKLRHRNHSKELKDDSQLGLLVGLFGTMVLTGAEYGFLKNRISQAKADGGCGGGGGCGGCGGCGG